jgi:hypothetical protein
MKTAKPAITSLLALCLLTACGSTEETEPEEPEFLLDLSRFESEDGVSCIPLTQISTTKIIGNQAIEFKMRGGTDYINILPRKCHALSPNRILSWETSLNRLCRLDILKVLDRVGSDIQMVGACGLGYFHPLPEDATAIPDDEG